MNTWVISGCSSGLGRCWTQSIIEDRGERVIGITRSTDTADELLAAYCDLFVPCIADVRDGHALGKLLHSKIGEVGCPNRVVTAAGYAQFGTLEDLSNNQLREQFQTNVEGALNVIRPLLPCLRKSGSARILLVSSMSGIACWPLLGAYQISKYGIEAISDTLRQELKEFNIQVGCIEPGPHKTGWATTYARRQQISSAYNAEELTKKSSCGYIVEPPQASLPFFWKMFDEPVMPRRITTSMEFVSLAVTEAEQKIQDWRASL